MLPRIVPALRTAATVQRLGTRSMSAYVPEFVPDKDLVTLTRQGIDSLPVRKGSWTEANSKRQTKYNMYLLLSSAVLGVTLAYTYQSGAMGMNPEPFAK